MSFIGNIFGGGGSNAPTEAAHMAAKGLGAQLKWYDKNYGQARDIQQGALSQLNTLYSGDPTQSPVYQAQMANIDNMTQDAVDMSMSQQAATGGTRGGNQQAAFGDITEQSVLAGNQALADAYEVNRRGLEGFTHLNTGVDQMGNVMGNIGQVLGQGIMGQAQYDQMANQAGFGTLIGLGNLGISGYNTFG